MRLLIVFEAFVFCNELRTILGHGRMIEPPQRSSMWRFGFPVEKNYDDNELFCGGFSAQWKQNGGKCGVCGDAYQGPRHNEAGGKYASGIISRKYKHGDVIPVIVDLTANHEGYFVFHICPNNDTLSAVSEECLAQHPVYILETNSYKYHVREEIGETSVKMTLVLPSDVWCWQCVLQWKYHAGNSWGCFENGKCCIGCGPQENFVNCADIAVTDGDDEGERKQDGGWTNTSPKSTNNTPGTPSGFIAAETEERATNKTIEGSSGVYENDDTVASCPKHLLTCHPVGAWNEDHDVEIWCLENCPAGNCPKNYCLCNCSR